MAALQMVPERQRAMPTGLPATEPDLQRLDVDQNSLKHKRLGQNVLYMYILLICIALAMHESAELDWTCCKRRHIYIYICICIYIYIYIYMYRWRVRKPTCCAIKNANDRGLALPKLVLEKTCLQRHACPWDKHMAACMARSAQNRQQLCIASGNCQYASSLLLFLTLLLKLLQAFCTWNCCALMWMKMSRHAGSSS